MTTVKEESDRSSKSKKGERISDSIFDLSDSEREERTRRAEESEDARFDEQGYLDAYVDQDGEIAALLEMHWSTENGATLEQLDVKDGETSSQPWWSLVLIDVLFAYCLTLRQNGGPPLSSAWLVTALSRSMSSDAAPPPTDATTFSVLRSSCRRGLVFPLHRSWLLCQKALLDLRDLLGDEQRVQIALQRIQSCLLDGAEEMLEGPDEAERWRSVAATVVGPLRSWSRSLDAARLAQMVTEVEQAEQRLNKAAVAPSWDLELLEKMAQEVMEEEQAGAEARLDQHGIAIEKACNDLCPPADLVQEGYDAFATPLEPSRRATLDRWTQSAPSKLKALARERWMYSNRYRRHCQSSHADRTATKEERTDTHIRLVASCAVACSRFLSSDLPWSCPASKQLAERILAAASSLTLYDRSIRWILVNHVRPLFTATAADPGSVNEEGRARHQRAHLSGTTVTRGYQGDAPAWKGHIGQKVSGQNGLFGVGAAIHLTLATCFKAVEDSSRARRRSRAQQKQPAVPSDLDPWESLWPLLLPPLMRLLEDTEPRWRFRGAEILSSNLLGPSEKARELLYRANLVPHVETVLFDGLTYLSSPPHGIGLVDVALSSLRILADYAPAKGASDDRQLQPAEKRMRIVQDGILRAWSLAPRSVTEPPDILRESSGTATEEHDLLAITYSHLAVLYTDLGPLAARYIDVTLEFICAQLEALYDHVVEKTQGDVRGIATRTAAASRGRRRALWSRARAGVEAVDALVQACLVYSAKHSNRPSAVPLVPPNLVQWSGRVLSALVKTQLALCDAPRVGIDVDGGAELLQRRLLARSVRKLWVDTWSRDVVKSATSASSSPSETTAGEGSSGPDRPQTAKAIIRSLEGDVSAALGIDTLSVLFDGCAAQQTSLRRGV
ncbi:unnamed protein product [Parajaminaea phylloscopi]